MAGLRKHPSFARLLQGVLQYVGAWPLLAVGLLGLGIASTGSAAVLPDRPTPAHWDQWQPQTDHSDARLEGRVAVWHSSTKLSDLLAELSAGSSVELATVPDLAAVDVSCYLGPGSLRSVMIWLAELVGGYWVFARAEEPRVYCLSTSRPPPDLADDQLMYLVDAVDRAHNEPYLDARRDRMQAYEAALGLPADELLGLHEESDPWLCAMALDPALRPMIQHVVSLSAEARRQLLEQGHVEMPLRAVSDALVQHLARWSKGEFGGVPSYMSPGIDPDRFLEFDSPEKAWAHASIAYVWLGDSLQVQLNVPDYGRWYTGVMTQPSTSPYFARQRLASLGYEKNTPEYQKRIEEETDRWQRAHGVGPDGPAAGSEGDVPAPSRPWQSDARLNRHLDLTTAAVEGRVGVSALMEQVARQCELDAMALYVPPERYVLAVRDDTAAALLTQVETDLHGNMAWRLHGDYLLGLDRDPLLWMATVPPDSAIAGLRELLAAGKPIAIDDLASLVGDLNAPQAMALQASSPRSRDLDVRFERVRLYGSLSSLQRDALKRGEQLSARGLTRRQQGMLLYVAREERPWVKIEDVAGATLRLEQVKLSTLDAGMSLVVDYHFPSDDADRDEVFRVPYELSPASTTVGPGRSGY
jgi:hypothetical protein